MEVTPPTPCLNLPGKELGLSGRGQLEGAPVRKGESLPLPPSWGGHGQERGESPPSPLVGGGTVRKGESLPPPPSLGGARSGKGSTPSPRAVRKKTTPEKKNPPSYPPESSAHSYWPPAGSPGSRGRGRYRPFGRLSWSSNPALFSSRPGGLRGGGKCLRARLSARMRQRGKVGGGEGGAREKVE
ncbi:unnamed protein product [Natator depressus]